MTQGELIKAVREKQGMNMRDFAAALGVSHAAVSLWELDKAQISDVRISDWLVDKRRWLADLGTDLFWMRYGETMTDVMRLRLQNVIKPVSLNA